MRPTASSLSRHFWLWGSAGAIGGMLAYASAGPSAFVLAGIATGIAPIWLGARYYEQRTDRVKTVLDLDRQGRAMRAGKRWSGQEPASVHLTESPQATKESEAPEAPRLRLLQPYERPLLPFTGPAHPPAGEPNGDEESLEMTVDELLVDLEETLSLIRSLKDKHTKETFEHQSS